MKCWVYVFEDGQIGVSCSGPTPVDLQLVSGGMLTILHSASPIVQINDDNRPDPLTPCIVEKAGKEAWHILTEEE